MPKKRTLSEVEGQQEFDFVDFQFVIQKSLFSTSKHIVTYLFHVVKHFLNLFNIFLKPSKKE